jgi:hypothetical protein
MPRIGNMTVKGSSGKDYEFGVYPRSDTFKALGAVYIMTKRTPKPDGGGGTHEFICIG